MRNPTSYCVMLIVSLAVATLSVAEEPLAILAEGTSFEGMLVAADSTGALVFETKEGRQELSVGGLVRWGVCSEPDRAPVFLLRDGTLLVAGILEANDKELAVDSDALGLVRLPFEQLAAVVRQLPASRLDRDRLLDDSIHNDEETARVIMLNGDQMRGELVELGDESISLRTGVGLVELELERISTLAFPSSPGATKASSGNSTVVGLADGSRVAVREFIVDEQTAKMRLVGGLSWEADVKDVVFLQPASSRITYLSDLAPAGYRHVPYLARTWRYATDRNVQGGMMRCAGQLHLKGLGMHTAARMSFVPPEGAGEFQASLAIDDGTEGMGSVRFRVFVDGKQKYVSPTIRGRETPIPVSLDVRGSERIDLVVDFADRADVQDHANWLDARFVLEE